MAASLSSRCGVRASNLSSISQKDFPCSLQKFPLRPLPFHCVKVTRTSWGM
jgi:hypothetical protein